MSVDFAALAEAVVTGLPDVRACLILSRDGLILAAHPAAEESRALNVWDRVATLGDVERGFLVVGEQMWSLCRRGAYTALAISGAAARAGIVLDRLEQCVLAAEEDRVRKESLRTPLEQDPAPQGDQVRGLRTQLHPEAGRLDAERTRAAQASTEEDPWGVDAVDLAREFHGLVE
jgi:hypothetical protein